MRPGAPLGFGALRGMSWLGLPGNPVSAMVTFELFGRPLLRRLRGESRIFRQSIDVRVEEQISIAAPLTHFLRAVVRWDTTGPTARLTGPQGSGLLTSMSRANALVIVPPERPVVRAGESLRALLIGDSALMSDTFDV
jgi:molybdopterin molybdotransferase